MPDRMSQQRDSLSVGLNEEAPLSGGLEYLNSLLHLC